jgi:predicted transport protein
VDIALDRNHDNPQLIFESLNSTGLELSQADLIRNYVLMGLDVVEQSKVYSQYWYPMEQRLSKAEYVPMFDRFMRDYLTVKSKSGAIPNIYDVYTSFKTYRFQHEGTTIAEIVSDIYRYARHFIKLAYAEDEDKEIAATLADINSLKVDVAYPLLLEVYDDYSNNLLSRDDFLAILRLVESYVFRRSVCGIPTNSMNKTFATFTRDIDKSRYRESVEAAFLAKDSYRRFPRDPEFVAAFVVKDVYNFRSRNYLLRKLENEGRKEPITVEQYTIEHILPQNENLSPSWRAELGPEWQQVHSTYLHTIGNLTLTGYNSELSDRPFLEKRQLEGGFDESPLRLNATVAHHEHWNKDEILQRAQMLADKAAKIWAAPALAPEALARYTRLGEAEGTRSYALNETNYGSYLQGDLLALFEQLRKRILNLDSSVREEVKAYYIAYKATTNFVDIVPQKHRLRLTLNMRYDEIVDPLGVCRDVTNLGRWGNGDVEVSLDSADDVENVMFLVEQAFDKHREDAA